ncbi:MAG: DUF3820 family protein [Bacteroidota bacterium]
MDPTPEINSGILKELIINRMPYGKYKGLRICDLPEPYLVWMSGKGFPNNKLGMLLGTIYEIKLNGLEYLLKPLKQMYR